MIEGAHPPSTPETTGERRYRALVEALGEIVWTAGPEGENGDPQPGWAAFTGQSPEEILNGRWIEAVHPDDREKTHAAWADAARGKRAYEVEHRVRRSDGQYRHMRARAVPLVDDEGEILEWVGVETDVHEMLEAAEERRQLLDSERAARDELERASRIKDEFVATLSHELRTPLNAILGWTQLLAAYVADPDKVRQGLEVIERNARTQAQMISDLLDVSRIISGKMRLEPRSIDLAAVVDDAAGSVRLAAEAKGIRLEEVRPSGEARLVGDPDRLQQAVWNLLSNAIKFTPRGGRVTVELRVEGPSAEIAVTDDGQGFPPEMAQSLFERFRQADASTTRRHGGLGLGLSIVKQLVELHGGTVSGESPGEGRGATFRIVLPLSPAFAAGEGAAPEPDPGRPAAAAFHGSLDGVRVLVVDDQPDAADVVRRLLEERGAEVEVAASAVDAMERLRERRPDVLLSDLGMPDEDGFSLVRRLRALPAADGGAVPAIALSALARPQDRDRAFAAGYQTHLAKPIDPAALFQAVAALAGRPPGMKTASSTVVSG